MTRETLKDKTVLVLAGNKPEYNRFMREYGDYLPSINFVYVTDPKQFKSRHYKKTVVLPLERFPEAKQYKKLFECAKRFFVLDEGKLKEKLDKYLLHIKALSTVSQKSAEIITREGHFANGIREWRAE